MMKSEDIIDQFRELRNSWQGKTQSVPDISVLTAAVMICQTMELCCAKICGAIKGESESESKSEVIKDFGQMAPMNDFGDLTPPGGGRMV